MCFILGVLAEISDAHSQDPVVSEVSSGEDREFRFVSLEDCIAAGEAGFDELLFGIQARDEAIEPRKLQFRAWELPDSRYDLDAEVPSLELPDDWLSHGWWARRGEARAMHVSTRQPHGGVEVVHAAYRGGVVERLLRRHGDWPRDFDVVTRLYVSNESPYRSDLALGPQGVGDSGVGWVGRPWGEVLPVLTDIHLLGTEVVRGRPCTVWIMDQIMAEGGVGDGVIQAPLLVWFDQENFLAIRRQHYGSIESASSSSTAARSSTILDLEGRRFGLLQQVDVLAWDALPSGAALPTKSITRYSIPFDPGVRYFYSDGMTPTNAARRYVSPAARSRAEWTAHGSTKTHP